MSPQRKHFLYKFTKKQALFLLFPPLKEKNRQVLSPNGAVACGCVKIKINIHF
jgi:hypothetical protein